MESIFKYAMFHYNRMVTDSHNLSHKIRLRGDTLSLMTEKSTVKTIQDGIETNFCLLYSFV